LCRGWRADRCAPSDLPELRFGVLLHKQGQDFYKAFADELQRAVALVPGVRRRLVPEYSVSQAPSEMAGHLRAMAALREARPAGDMRWWCRR
jgi:LacI family transcriptional regulator